MDESRYDLFVSYADADHKWVAGFLLPALGLPADRVITQQSLTPGAAQAEEFERAIVESRFTVLVLTRAYLADRWAMFGEQLVTWSGVEGRTQRLIPLRLEALELPLRLSFQESLDFTDTKEWANQAGRLRDLLGEPVPAPERPIDCPYPGLAAYERKDADRFVGREALVREIVGRLLGQSYLTLIGASGSGKTSLINAGVIPALEADPRFGEGSLEVVRFRPGDAPIDHLASEIARHTREDGPALAAALATDPAVLVDALARVLAAHPGATRGLLIVDQFEEVFAQCKDPDRRARFFDLASLVDGMPAGWHLIVAVRADFYGDVLDVPALGRLKAAAVDVPTLAEADLRRAIDVPAERVGVYIETRLVDRLVEDAAGERGPLPLVQQALVALWTAFLRRRLLTLADYESLGTEGRTGLQEALKTWADSALTELSNAGEEEVARRIFVRLIAFGEERKDTRRQQTRDELLSAGADEDEVDQVLATLVERRLITTDRDDETGEVLVDLAHETLIEAWPTLGDWVKTYEAMESERRQVVLSAAAWRSHGRDSSYAFTGSRLRDLDGWLARWPNEVGRPELEFVEASRRAERDRKRRRVAVAAMAVGLAAIVLIAASFVGIRLVAPPMTRSEVVGFGAGPAVITSEDGAGADQVVPLDAFRIEASEVSIRQYRTCYENGGCDAPPPPADASASADAFPVTSVSARQAAAYCRWVGRRLPSVQEWERAARGADDAQWPWPGYVAVPEPVAALPSPGASGSGPFHLLDNVAEWVTASRSDTFAYVGVAYGMPDEGRPPIKLDITGSPDRLIGFRCAEGGS